MAQNERAIPLGHATQPPIPQYGIDAPGVMRVFFAAALGLFLAAGAIALSMDRPWLWMALLPGLCGVAAASLGTSMATYSTRGKQALRDHLLRQRNWRGDEVTLDLGAGSGLMAIGAALRCRQGRVIALDIWNSRDLSGNSADALLRNAMIEGVRDRIEIVTGDIRRLVYPDNSIDCIVSVFCIHNIEPAADRMLACSEIARVLAPGGMAMIADFPSTAAYVKVLRDCGLSVAGPYRAERIALGVAGYLIAVKPIPPI